MPYVSRISRAIPMLRTEPGDGTVEFDLTTRGSGNDNFSYEWRGARLPKGRRWRYSRENLDQMDAEGRIEFRKSGFPVGKRYLDELPEASIQYSEEV